MDLSSVFDKKVGDFNKKEIGKSDIYWLKDSERLLYYIAGLGLPIKVSLFYR